MAAARTGLGLTVLLLASTAALALPPRAAADGDPASDVLLTQGVFVPFTVPISSPIAQQLASVVERARQAGYPIKVAIVGSPYDLGSVSSLYGKPDEYARFLGSELTFAYRGRLQIAMPQGYGYDDGLRRRGPELRILKGLSTAKRSHRLVESATRAVARLAAATGHPVTVPPLAAKDGGHTLALLVAGALVASALLAFAVGLAVWLRRGATLQDS